jgi:nucleoside-diphosphate-sugar epimerase
MQRVVITGASGLVGTRLVSELGHRSDVEVVAVDTRSHPHHAASDHVRQVTLDLATATPTELDATFTGANVVVHLAATDPDTPDAPSRDGELFDRVLRAADRAAISHLVMVSSAAVYGARLDNAVPLTENARLRPIAGFPYALGKVDLERRATAFRDQHRDATVAMLRPAPVYGPPGVVSWLAEATLPPFGDRIGQNLPAQQYLHIDDLVAAIAHCVSHHLDGVFNVAPDGWIPGAEAPALLGAVLGTVPMPAIASDVISGTVDWVQGKRQSSGARPYTQAPWVVANDRLKATGWAPRSSSAETFVAHHPPTAWSKLIARRRQEVTLGVVGAIGLTVAAVVSTRINRFLRR